MYQERVYDLLCEDSAACSPAEVRREKVESEAGGGRLLRQAAGRGVGQMVGSVVAMLLRCRRAVAGTLLNTVSSRSHMMVRLCLQSTATTTTLNLVDLAGSERLRDSGAEGERLQETRAINRDYA